MGLKKLQILNVFIFLNFIYFVRSFAVNDMEASDMDTNIKDPLFNVLSNYEEKVLLMEEKLKSLTDTFNELELKMATLINENMDKMEEKMTSIYNKTKSYKVHELKCSDDHLPRDCYDLQECSGNIYSIMVPEVNNKPFPAVCDLKTSNGGWTVIQRRKDGSQNFYRNWTDYVDGFGDLKGEFFIGLNKLHALTSLGKPQELYIMLKDFEGVDKYARYGVFKVDDENSDYTLTVGQYSGNAGDSLSKHSGYKFSTKDRDNDDNSDRNCAEKWKGAWWYHKCYNSNLNGLYLMGREGEGEGVAWGEFRGVTYSLKFVQMMIRSKTE